MFWDILTIVLAVLLAVSGVWATAIHLDDRRRYDEGFLENWDFKKTLHIIWNARDAFWPVYLILVVLSVVVFLDNGTDLGE